MNPAAMGRGSILFVAWMRRSRFSHPEAGPVQFGQFRRLLVARFPFAIFYTVEPKAVVVHGVFHSSRDPDKIRESLAADDGN